MNCTMFDQFTAMAMRLSFTWMMSFGVSPSFVPLTSLNQLLLTTLPFSKYVTLPLSACQLPSLRRMILSCATAFVQTTASASVKKRKVFFVMDICFRFLLFIYK